MMKGVLVWVLLVISSGALAAGEMSCADREYFIKGLEKEYSEVVQHRAITSRGALVEITVSPEGGWSMLLTTPGGVTCIITAGEDWEDVPRLEGTSA